MSEISKTRIVIQMEEHKRKAWDALGRYKFLMFGYHAACWVNLKKLLGGTHRNPFSALVRAARKEASNED